MESLFEVLPSLDDPTFKFIAFLISALLILLLAILKVVSSNIEAGTIRFLKFIIYVFGTIWILALALGFYHNLSSQKKDKKKEENIIPGKDSVITEEVIETEETAQKPIIENVEFYGVVVDKTDDNILAGAQINCKGTLVATTDINGTYKFILPFPKGHREMIMLQVIKENYVTGNFTLSSQGGYKKIKLTSKPQ